MYAKITCLKLMKPFVDGSTCSCGENNAAESLIVLRLELDPEKLNSKSCKETHFSFLLDNSVVLFGRISEVC